MPPLQPGFSKGLAEFLSRTELLTSQRGFKALPGARLLQQPAVYSARDTSQHPLHPVSTQHPNPALWSHPRACPSHPPGSPVLSLPRASTHTPLSLDVRLPFPTCFPTWPAVHLCGPHHLLFSQPLPTACPGVSASCDALLHFRAGPRLTHPRLPGA